MEDRNYRMGDPVIYRGQPWRIYWNYRNGELEIVREEKGYGNGIPVKHSEVQFDSSRVNAFPE